MPDVTTMLNNLIDPEVIGDYVEQKFVNKSVFAPLCEIDSTLENSEGSELSLPRYAYIGGAQITPENTAIDTALLTSEMTKVGIIKLTKGCEITDEAVLSAHGDPMGEASSQIALAIADGVDELVKGKVDDGIANGDIPSISIAKFNSDAVVDAEAVFGEDINDKPMALLTGAKGVASLRKDENYINGSEIQTANMITGAIGDIWGASVIPSNKAGKTINGERRHYLIKSGSLRLLNKRGIFLETERIPKYKKTALYADKIGGAYVYKPTDIVVMREFVDVYEYNDSVTVKAGTSGTNLIDADALKNYAPWDCKVVYKVGTNATPVVPTFGTALTGYTDWVDAETEVTVASGKNISVVVVDAENKPLVYTNVTSV